jgi:hypothetical protein
VAPATPEAPDAFEALVGVGGRGRRRAADPAAPADDPADDGATPSRPPRRGAGRLVLAVVALAVVGVLALAVANLSSIGGALGISSSPSRGTPAPAGSTAPAGATAAPATAAAAGAPRGITAVHALDPLGDGTENDDKAGRAVDGDPATAWSSSTYRTAALGGLKPGVGLALDLGSDAAVSSVDLTVAGTGGTVEVRSSSTGSYDGSTVLATAPVGSGSGAPVVVRLPKPVTTRWVVLWFTSLPPADGGFRVDLSEVTVH